MEGGTRKESGATQGQRQNSPELTPAVAGIGDNRRGCFVAADKLQCGPDFAVKRVRIAERAISGSVGRFRLPGVAPPGFFGLAQLGHVAAFDDARDMARYSCGIDGSGRRSGWWASGGDAIARRWDSLSRAEVVVLPTVPQNAPAMLLEPGTRRAMIGPRLEQFREVDEPALHHSDNFIV